MDIPPSYKCLVKRPWIHFAGAVPSSLHQRLKFIIANKAISIEGEENIVATISTNAPHIELDKDIPEFFFQSFEFVNTTYVKEGLLMVLPRLSESTHMGLKLTVGKSAKVGKGFKKHL